MISPAPRPPGNGSTRYWCDSHSFERSAFPRSVIWNVAWNLSFRGGCPPAAMSVARLVQSRARSARSRYGAKCVKSSGSVSARRCAIHQLNERHPRNGAVLIADVGGELWVAQERVRNAEREAEPDDASGSGDQLFEELSCGPAGRLTREEPSVHAGRVDAVGVPARRVRGDGDDLPPLVARPLRRTEVDADDHVNLMALGGAAPARSRAEQRSRLLVAPVGPNGRH